MLVEGREFANNGKQKKAALHDQQDGLLMCQFARSVMIVIPSLFSLPTMFFSIPPLVILFPAMLTFGIQIMTPGIGLGAVITMLVDRSVQI
jgi:hypothetical protein